jgi:guanine deaminase
VNRSVFLEELHEMKSRFAGHLLLPDGDHQTKLVPGFLIVEDGIIIEVIEERLQSFNHSAKHTDVGGVDSIIMPGFIDAHLHLPQFDLIGAHGMPLLDWLDQVTFPSERRWENVDFASAMTHRVLQQCLAHGTTTICAYATVHHESTKAALHIATELGMSGVIGQVLMDRNAPDYLLRDADQLIDEAAMLLRQYPATNRMSVAVTPRFAISCTEELLANAGRLAKESNAIVQTHLSENLAECDLVKQLFDGRDYVAVYSDTGLVGSKTIFGHGIHLSDFDRQRLSLTQSIIAHCPTANSFLRSGTMQRSELLMANVPVAIGSDIGAGYERSMVRVARAMIEAASSISHDFPNASEAWHAITAGNAKRLRFVNVGSLEVGKRADLLEIKPDIDWQSHQHSPLAMLMFAWDDRWLKRVYLGGKQV